MLNWIHCRTTDLREAVPLDLVFVVVGTSLEHWLLNTATTGTDSNDGASA